MGHVKKSYTFEFLVVSNDKTIISTKQLKKIVTQYFNNYSNLIVGAQAQAQMG